MATRSDVRTRNLDAIQELVARGQAILDKKEHHVLPHSTYWSVPVEEWHQWRIRCVTLLERLYGGQGLHSEEIRKIKQMHNDADYVVSILAVMKALKEDYEKALLSNLHTEVEAEVAADYIDQAASLLADEARDDAQRAAAAVIAGAVLERSLRTLCGLQVPPISVTGKNDQPLTLNPLIDAVKRAGLFNEMKAKQLQAWAHLRNHAAHGRFDQFDAKDVKAMLEGVTSFLADYMH